MINNIDTSTENSPLGFPKVESNREIRTWTFLYSLAQTSSVRFMLTHQVSRKAWKSEAAF